MSKRKGWAKIKNFYVPALSSERVRYINFNDGFSLTKIVNSLNSKGMEYDVIYDSNLVKVYSNKTRLKGNLSIPNGRTFVFSSGGYEHPNIMRPAPVRDQEDTFFIESQYTEVKTHLDNFLTSKQKYIDARFLYKLGFLLYGPPGNGKTAFIRYMVQNLLPNDATVVWMNTMPSIEGSKALSEIPGLKVLIFEEITNSLRDSSSISTFLNFMDGEQSFGDCIIIATTNYPENLPKNVVERPGRFDKIIKLGNPDKKVREFLLKKFLDVGTVEEEDLDACRDFTVSQIKEACKESRFYGITYKEACDKIKEHKELVAREFDDRDRMGF